MGLVLEGRALLWLLRLQNRATCGTGSPNTSLGAALHPPHAHHRLCHPRPARSAAVCAGRRARSSAAAVEEQRPPAVASAAPVFQQQQQQEEGAPHVSVLLHEVLGFFEGLSVGTYVDGTLGAAGHAGEVLRAHSELTTLVGFDLDSTARSIAAARLEQLGARVVPITPTPSSGGKRSAPAAVAVAAASAAPTDPAESAEAGRPVAFIVHSNFGALGSVLPQLEGGRLVGQVDALLLDLGMSSMQVDESARGFSFLRDGPLDMRMDPSCPATPSAEELVNGASEAELGRIFRDYGEERYWRSIARRVVEAREVEPITTTQQLVRVIGAPGGGSRGKRGDAKQKHPATRVFQALRIAVNGELESITRALPAAIDSLRPGGRLAVITFHSLEDRIVKWAFRQAAGMAPSDEALPSYCAPFEEPLPQPLVKILTRRPVLPSEEEQRVNSRSRSAKLRVVERL